MATTEPTRYDFPPKTPESHKRRELPNVVLALFLAVGVGLVIRFIVSGLHHAPAQKPDMGITIRQRPRSGPDRPVRLHRQPGPHGRVPRADRSVTARIGCVIATTPGRGSTRGFNGNGYVVFSLCDPQMYELAPGIGGLVKVGGGAPSPADLFGGGSDA